jgi:hypothetical protein
MSIKHIRIASDLHLEAFYGRDYETLGIDFLPKDERDAESILVLAGDISSHPEQLLGFLNVCCKRFARVYFVPGNHELYKHDIVSYPKEILDAIMNRRELGAFANLETAMSGVSYEELNDLKIRFIFGTLWADGGPNDWARAEVSRYLNDFRLITKGMTPLSTARIPFKLADMVKIHKEHKAKIEKYLKQPFDGRTVVITHHLPSRRLVSARFWPGGGSDGANGGFASDCDNLIALHEPWLWIHGHTHDRISTKLWNTQIECNPAGYRGEWNTPHNMFHSAPVFIDLETTDPAQDAPAGGAS